MLQDSTICVIGGDSLIGAALSRELHRRGISHTSTTRRPGVAILGRIQLDLADSAAIAHFEQFPGVAYICCAVTNMRRCEDDPLGSSRVNVKGACEIAARLQASGTHVVFLSTDAVFDGHRPYPRADDPVAPAHEYGRQKARAEQCIAALGPGTAIVRLTKVLDGTLPLIREWRRALLGGELIRPFTDLRMAPISLSFAVRGLLAIGLSRLDGFFHLSGAEDVSYAQFARLFAAALKVADDRVRPVSSEEAGVQLARAPQYAALAMNNLECRLGLLPQSVRDVAEKLVSEQLIGRASND